MRLPDPATVSHVQGGYPLPEGLPPGAIVRVLEFDHGFYSVEYEGKPFKIFSGCAERVPRHFHRDNNAQAFFLRIREIVRSGLIIALEGRNFRFSVFSDNHKPRGELFVHQDAILNLGAELADRVGRQLLGIASRRD